MNHFICPFPREAPAVKLFRELGWKVWITEHRSPSELQAREAQGRASPQEEFWNATVEEFDFVLPAIAF